MKKYIKPSIENITLTDPLLFGINNTVGDGTQLGKENFFEDEDANIAQVRQLHERIGKLGLVDRAIVMLWLEDLSYDEIGAIVGITPQNVGVKLFRIKEQLKKM